MNEKVASLQDYLVQAPVVVVSGARDVDKETTAFINDTFLPRVEMRVCNTDTRLRQYGYCTSVELHTMKLLLHPLRTTIIRNLVKYVCFFCVAAHVDDGDSRNALEQRERSDA